MNVSPCTNLNECVPILPSKRFLASPRRSGLAWWVPVFLLLGTVAAVNAKGLPRGVVISQPQERTVDQDYAYTTNNGTITITGYTGLGGTVIIPGKINTLPVVSIGDNAFYSCTKLVSVTISNNVASIGNNAFRSCTGLANIEIPASVTNIGDLAFSCCMRFPPFFGQVAKRGFE